VAVRVLVTGHHGYIGCALVPMLKARGHEVVGLDSFLFEGCDFDDADLAVPVLRRDIRDVRPEDLAGFDAVIQQTRKYKNTQGDNNPKRNYTTNKTK